MTPPVKLKWIYALMVMFIILLGAQMSIYIANSYKDNGLQYAIVNYSILGIIVGYTFIRIIWRLLTQVYLSWKWHKHVRSIQHVKLTKRLTYKYRSLNTNILVVNDESFIAMAIGMWKPTIVISSAVLDMFNDDEVKAIVLHEFHHCRNHDNVKLLVMKLLTEGFGYFPIMNSIYRYYQTWMELLADRFAIRYMGTELPLASVLLRLSSFTRSKQHAAGVHFADTTMNYRIAQVLNPSQAVKVKVDMLRPLLLSLSLLLLLIVGGDS